MAITTLAGIESALPGQIRDMGKIAGTAGLMSQFCIVGFPIAAATPSPGVAGGLCTSATAGAMVFTNPPSGNTYLGRMSGVVHGSTQAPTAGSMLLYDRLWHNSGLVTTTTTAQTVNSVALDRPDVNGTGAEAWFQVYGAMGAGTGGTMTLSYTNDAGTAGKTATLVPYSASSSITRTYPYRLAVGDRGVKSIQSETHDSTLTSGTYGLVIRRLIAICPISFYQTPDAIALGMPRVYDNACLEMLVSAAVATSLTATINLIQG